MDAVERYLEAHKEELFQFVADAYMTSMRAEFRRLILEKLADEIFFSVESVAREVLEENSAHIERVMHEGVIGVAELFARNFAENYSRGE